MRNIALVGAGYWGKNLARNLNDLEALKTICDPSAEVRARKAEKYPEVSVTDDFQSILDDDGVVGVFLAVPAVKHYDMAMAALKAGKHVFVEKPLALNVEEGKDLVETAEKLGLQLFVGHILHYHSAAGVIKKLVGEGSIGKLQYVYSNRLNLGKIRTEENILWSFAPHDISLILGIVDEEPCYVQAEGSSVLNPGIADITMTNLKFPSGVAAHIFVSWLNPFKEQRLVVVGSRGMLVFDDTKPIDEKLVIYRHAIEWQGNLPLPKKADGEAIKLSDDWKEPLREECKAFIDAIESGKEAVTSGAEGLRVLKVLKSCQQSIESNELDAKRKADAANTPKKPFFAHHTAFVDDGAVVGDGTKIWHFSHILDGAELGDKCILGQNVSIAGGVKIGNNVKIQNNVSVYTGTIIEDDVFLGPSCVLTNVSNPRSQVVRHSLYETTVFRRGATVGANATIVCGTTLGRYCFIAAGTVVTKDVPDYALIMGNPGRQKGWMSRHGHILRNPDADGVMVCPESGYRYKEVEPGIMRCLDLDEESSLPAELSSGSKSYDELKTE